MSDFTALILAKLDTKQVESQLQNIQNKKLTFNNVDASSITSKIQSELNSHKFSINVEKVNISGANSSATQAGQLAGKKFTSAFTAQAKNTTSAINNMKAALSSAGVKDSAISSITKNLEQMDLKIKTITTRMRSGGRFQMQITGVDDLGRGVTLLRELDTETGKIRNMGQTITHAFSSGTTSVSKFALASQRATKALTTGSLDASISKLVAQYEKLGAAGNVKLSGIKANIQQLEALKTAMNASYKTGDTSGLTNKYERFNAILAKTKNSLAMVSAESKTFASGLQIAGLSNNISTWMSKNTKASRDFGGAIKTLQSQLSHLGSSGNATVGDLKRIETQFKSIKTAATQAGQTGKSFGSQFKGALASISKYISASSVMFEGINAMKQMASNALNVDTAMTELYRVTDLSTSKYDSLYSKMNNDAKQYGTSLSGLINSTARWVQLGFDADTSSNLADITATYQHVTDLDEDTAVNNLVTAYKGYEKPLLEANNGDQAAAVEQISDIYDKMGKFLPLKNYIG